MFAPERFPARRLPGYAFAVLGVALLAWALPATASAAGSLARPQPRILSASWGTDNAVGCPSGAQGLDNIPVTFNWFIRRASIQPADFRIVRSDGSVATPTCALQFPPDESDEAQTVNLIGDFGDSVNGPTPAAIRVVGALRGKPPGARHWRRIGRLPKISVEPLSGGPYIVDAWTLMPSIYRGDRNRCLVGRTFVRVMWSNGLTAYPTGEEVGAAVTASYRALYKLPNGRTVAIAPLEVADLHDHESSFNADNMHDLCLPRIPRGATAHGSDDRRRADPGPQRRSQPRSEVQNAAARPTPPVALATLTPPHCGQCRERSRTPRVGLAAQSVGGGEAASAKGLPSESRQMAQRSPGWTIEPPSSPTRASAAAMSSTVK